MKKPTMVRLNGAKDGGLPDHYGMISVAERLAPVIAAFLGGEPPIAFRFWDGSSLGPLRSGSAVVLKSPRALTRLVYAPGELGFARAYVSDDLDIEGDIFEVLALRDMLEARTIDTDLRLNSRALRHLLRAVVGLSALSLPPPAPPEEVRLRGRPHSKNRDAVAISHHYDVGNDFYRLVLGDTMTYSCAYFEQDHMSLDEAQAAKYDLVCRKLGLEPGMRLLDVGCGWGGMVLHAARNYGVSAVGITLSREQAEFAGQRASESNVAHMVDIRCQDYRDVGDGPFDAISSIGMFEHVGLAQLAEYFAVLERLLVPRGRLLNQAISRRSGQPAFGSRSFVSRYVFPDGELQEVGGVVTAMQTLGLEARDVESLREHYARTLRCWVENLETNWTEAVDLAGLGRAKVWRLYMAGSAIGFEASRINVHQVLGVKPDDDGASGMPSNRSAWVTKRSRPHV
jgi:cyclopropane-fatty-acyl-phospholipid synthase